MKVRTLVEKDTKNFMKEDDGYVTSSKIPILLYDTQTIERFKETCIEDEESNFDNVEIIEFDLIECDKIGADIRNKLSPLNGLISLLERQKNADDDMKKKIQVYIDKEIEQCKKSIEYLSNLL